MTNGTNLNFYVSAVYGSNPFLLLGLDPFFDGIHLAELGFNSSSWLKTSQVSKVAFSYVFSMSEAKFRSSLAN